MDSCFGARSLFGGHSSTDTLFSSTQLEVIQDLDLYFIRQIAHSLGALGMRVIARLFPLAWDCPTEVYAQARPDNSRIICTTQSEYCSLGTSSRVLLVQSMDCSDLI
ncbi:hypothetical protein MRX96_006695 [Rhipicephalus microplus]